MADYVTLSCKSCGAKLDITNDIDRFACSYCGQEHLVKRAGGLVSIALVVGAIEKVGRGVDKTAAELAIVRIQEEIHDLHTSRNTIFHNAPDKGIGCFFILLIIGGLPILFEINFSIPFDTVGYIGLAIMGIGLVIWIISGLRYEKWEENIKNQVFEIDEKIQKKQEELEINRAVVRR
jgi:DNA-directed RNA polymerase subunit RPC12/RpoP